MPGISIIDNILIIIIMKITWHIELGKGTPLIRCNSLETMIQGKL